MQIVRAFFKIAYHLKGSILMYIGIFFSVGMIIAGSIEDTGTVFEQSRLKVVVFDEDGTFGSGALRKFIAKNHDVIEMENDPEKLWDSLYYHEINYVLTIQECYLEKMERGDTEALFTYSVDPQSYACEYLNLQLRQYVSVLSGYLAGGREFEEAQTDTLAALEDGTPVTARDFSSDGSLGRNAKFFVFLHYLAYVMPAIMITVLSRWPTVFCSFSSPLGSAC